MMNKAHKLLIYSVFFRNILDGIAPLRWAQLLMNYFEYLKRENYYHKLFIYHYKNTNLFINPLSIY